MTNFWDEAELISRYTRAQALEDGVLVAVPAELAAQAGFRWPLALTAAAWADAVAWDALLDQDDHGTARELMTAARRALVEVATIDACRTG